MLKKWIMILFMLLMVQTSLVLAEDDEFSPWEAWRQGFSNYEKGEQSKNRGNNEEALRYFKNAREYYVAVQNNRPEWNQKIIGSRIKMCDQEINELKGAISSKRDSAESEERVSTKASARSPAYSSSSAPSTVIPSSASISSFGRDVDNDTNETKAELEKYKKKLFAVLVEVDELRRQAERGQSASKEVENLIKEKGVIQQQLSLLQQKYDTLNEKIIQPDTEKNELKNRMLEEKMKLEILTQKLKMQDDNYEKIRREMADLYKEKTEAKFLQQQSDQKIRELNDKILRYEKDNGDRGVQIRALNAQIEQLTQTSNVNLANIKEKQEEINKLNKWTEELREKGGSQSKMSSEIMNENKAIREKFDSMKALNEKMAVENQELKNKQLEQHISFTRIKDTVKLINDQKNNIVDEYNNLTQKYNQSILTEGANAKEIQNLREQNTKLDRELKLFVDKYEKIQKRLEERSANEYQTILAVNKTNSELTEKLNVKSEELLGLKLKYEQLTKAGQDNVNALADLKAKLYAMNAENSSLREESKNLVAVKSEVQALQQDSQMLRKEKAEIASQRDKYQTALDSSTKEFTALKKELLTAQEASGELPETRKQVQTLKNEIAEFKNADKMNVQLREELKAMIAVKDENQQLNEQLTRSRNAIAELRDKSLKQAEAGDKTHQAFSAMELENKNLKLSLAEKDKALDLFREENKKALANQQQIQESLKESAKNDKDKIASLDEINKRLADRMNTQMNEELKIKTSLRDENQQLSEQLAKSRNVIAELRDKSLKQTEAGDKTLQAVSAMELENKNLKLLLAEKDKALDLIKEESNKALANQQQIQESLKDDARNDKNKLASLGEINKRLVDRINAQMNEELKIKTLLKDENQQLSEQLANSRIAVTELKDKCLKLSATGDKIQQAVSGVELENKNLNLLLAEKEKALVLFKEESKKTLANQQQIQESLKDDARNDKNKLASLDEINKRLAEALDKSRSDNRTMEQSVNSLKAENGVLLDIKKRFEQVNLASNQIQQKAEKLVAENSALQNEIKGIADLKQENAELKLKTRDIAEIKENYKTLNSNYLEAIEQIKRLSNNSADEMNKKLGAMLEKSKSEKRELDGKVVAMQREISEIPNLKKQLNEYVQALKEYQGKYQAATESNAKISVDLAKLDDLKKANAELTTKHLAMVVLQDEYKKLQTSYQQLLQSVNSYQQSDINKLTALEENNKKINAMLEKSKSEKKELAERAAAIQNELAVIPSLRKQLNEQTQVLKEYQGKYQAATESNAKISVDLAKLDDLKKANAELTTKHLAMVVLQDEYKKLQTSYQQLLQSVNSYQQSDINKLTALEENNKKINAMLEKSKSEKKELAERVVAMQNELAVIPNLKSRIIEREQALKEYQNKSQTAAESISKINTELRKLDELKKANAELNSKNREMLAIQDDYKKLQASYQQALQNINSYQQSDRNKLAALDELNKKLTAMLDKSKNENQKLVQEVELLKQNSIVISALKEEISLLKSSRTGDAEAKKNLVVQQAKLESLKEQLSSMDSAVAVMKRQLAERDSSVLDLKTRLAGKSGDSGLSEKYAAAENKINVLAADLRESNAKIKSLELQLAERKSGTPEIKLITPAIPAAKIQELLTYGIAAEKKQDIEVALWHFQMVLDSEPSNLIAHRHLGKLYLQIEDYDKAVEHLARAAKADSKNSDCVVDYGFALLGARRYTQAVETFKNLIKTQSDNSRARLGLGSALQGNGDVKNAENEFRAALRIKPDSAEIMQKLALLLATDKDKSSEASELYRKSRKLGGSPEPELEKLLSGKLASANNEAVSFLQQSAADAEKNKDWGSATWYYSQLADLSPDNAEIMNKVCILYLLQNSPDKALKALKVNERDISALLTSAQAWIFKGNSVKALEMFTKAQAAIAQNPQYRRPELLKNLDSIVELKIKNLPDDKDKKSEKVYDLFKQLSKK